MNEPEPIFVRAGDIEIRMAATPEEIIAGQKLRYKVFYEEMQAKPSADVADQKRDYDDFDLICDHLLAFDTSRDGEEAVIATYRLLREEKITGLDDFYSSQEFDLTNLKNAHFQKLMGGRQMMELGRSCVHEDYRTNNVIQFMWKAIIQYVVHHEVGCLFGCASLAGIVQEDLKLPLSYLYHNFKTPDDYNVPAQKARYQKMDYFPRDHKELVKGKRQLAPLVRGYARLGCYIGDGAVIDEEFNTTDVFILLLTDRLREKNPQMFENLYS